LGPAAGGGAVSSERMWLIAMSEGTLTCELLTIVIRCRDVNVCRRRCRSDRRMTSAEDQQTGRVAAYLIAVARLTWRYHPVD